MRSCPSPRHRPVRGTRIRRLDFFLGFVDRQIAVVLGRAMGPRDKSAAVTCTDPVIELRRLSRAGLRFTISTSGSQFVLTSEFEWGIDCQH